MFRIISLLFIPLFISTSGASQNAWETYTGLPQEIGYHRVYLMNSDSGLLCDTYGRTKRTLDGGNTWQDMSAVTPCATSTFFWQDLDTGWAACAYGNISRTTDGGNSWTVINSAYLGSQLEFSKMSFIDSQVGWLCAWDNSAGPYGVIMKTTDGGLNWTDQVVPVTGLPRDIEFIDDMIGYASVGKSIIKTTDGGANWFDVFTGVATLQALDVIDASRIWSCAYPGIIIYSIDGGANWFPQSSGTTEVLRDIEFITPDVGLATGDNAILKTFDGGLNWIPQNNLPPFFGGDIFMLSEAESWILCGSPYGQVILKTTDSSDTWDVVPMNALNFLQDVAFSDSASGWAVGNCGKIFRTTDQGVTWFLQNPNVYNSFKSISVINDTLCHVAGMCGMLVTTEDGGSTWDVENTGILVDINSVFFTDDQQGWFAADGGVLKTTTDGGDTWVDQVSGTTNDLQSIYFVDPLTGWAVGGEAIILHTTNGGSIWNEQNTDITEPDARINSVYFTDANNGWAVGHDIVQSTVGGGATAYGVIYKTIDGGLNWNELVSTSWHLSTFNDVFFMNDDTGWVTSNVDPGLFLRTMDGGNTWMLHEDFIPPGGIVSAVCVKDSMAWAVGGFGLYEGLILQSSDYGGSGGEYLAQKETVAENPGIVVYPNPFSNYSVIQFQNPTMENHSLRLYNITGELIFEVTNVQTNQFVVQRNQLVAGTYFFQLLQGSTIKGAGKLIVE